MRLAKRTITLSTSRFGGSTQKVAHVYSNIRKIALALFFPGTYKRKNPRLIAYEQPQEKPENLIFSLPSQPITLGLGLILPRLWIVSYGSEVNGLLSSLSQFLVYLSLFEAGVGAATMQALYKPVAQNSWDDINGVLSATHRYYKRTGTWYLIGLLGLSVLYPLLVDSSLPYITIFGAVFFSGIGNVVSFYLQGKYNFLLPADGKSYVTSILGTIIHILNSLVKILLISLNVNIVLILATTFLLQFVHIGYILWYVKKHYPKIQLDVPPNNAALAQKNFALIHQISGLIFNNADVLILTFFCDLRLVSVYSLFKMITSQLESLINIPLSSISFWLGQTYQTDKRLYTQRIDLVESYYSAMVYGLFSVALYLFLPFMRLYTDGVTDVNYVDPWLALLFVLCSLLDKSRVPMLNTINYAGHYQQTLSRTIMESSINLIVSLIGVCFLGIYGVLLGTVAALAYRTNDIILYSNHKLLNRSAKKTYAIYFVNVAVFLLTQVIFRLVFGNVPIASYLQFVIVGFGATCISLLMTIGAQILLFPNCRETAEVMVKRVIKSIKKS